MHRVQLCFPRQQVVSSNYIHYGHSSINVQIIRYRFIVSEHCPITPYQLKSIKLIDQFVLHPCFILDEVLRSNVTVLSFSRYYRYRAALKRCEHIEDEHTRMQLIQTLSGFAPTRPNMRIMFVKEEIDYPDLESHEMLCPHLAPKLKSRPKGRKKITSRVSECSSPASSEFSAESAESNDSDVFDGKRLVSLSLIAETQITSPATFHFR